MSPAEVRDLPDGLYAIHWRDGGVSLAAVGRNGAGEAWMAPTNWICVPSYDWSQVERAA